LRLSGLECLQDIATTLGIRPEPPVHSHPDPDGAANLRMSWTPCVLVIHFRRTFSATLIRFPLFVDIPPSFRSAARYRLHVRATTQREAGRRTEIAGLAEACQQARGRSGLEKVEIDDTSSPRAYASSPRYDADFIRDNLERGSRHLPPHLAEGQKIYREVGDLRAGCRP